MLKPLYKSGALKKGPDQFVPAWDNQKAGTIFEQMLVKTGNKIDGVAAANDGIANAVVVALKAAQPEADPAQRPGRDHAGRPEHHLGLADDDGLEGQRPRDQGGSGRDQDRQGPEAADDGIHHHQGPREGAAFLITPQSITKANYKLLFTSGFLKKSDVCNGTYTKYCK